MLKISSPAIGSWPVDRHRPGVSLAWLRASLAVVALLLGAASQAPVPARPPEPASLAHWVPATASFYVHVPRLAALHDALNRAGAAELLSMEEAEGAQLPVPFDLQASLLSLFPEADAALRAELAEAEVGLAARSFTGLGDGVWLLRLPEPDALERWFPPERRVSNHRSQTADFELFRTRDRLLVCVRDDVVALAARGTLLREAMRLMAGNDEPVLAAQERYRELQARLRPGYLASVYVAAADSAGGANANLGFWGPAWDGAVIAVHEAAGRLELAVHGHRTSDQPAASLSPLTISRLNHLPRTTLVAVAGKLAQPGRDAGTPGPPSSTSVLLSRMLGSLTDAGPDAAGEGRTSPGPDAIFVWAPDLRLEHNAPVLAVLIRTPRAEALREQLARVARQLLVLAVRADEQVDLSSLQVEHTRHYGTSIAYLQTAGLANATAHPALPLLAQLEPAFAASDGWLIASTSLAHLRRLLEAEKGLLPRLGDQGEVRPVQARDSELSLAALGQPRLAGDVLRDWLQAARKGELTVLDEALWSQPMAWARARQERLGIGMRTTQEPGVVVVARVYAGTPAEDKLRAGDRILAVNGRVLDLNEPNDCLRRRLWDSEIRPGPTLRVLREDQLIDVQLPGPLRADGPAWVPAEVARSLAGAANTVALFSLAVDQADARYVTARLSLALDE